MKDLFSHQPDLINEMIRSRRSVFMDQFDNTKRIPDEVVMEVLETANHAPTHKLTEPWRFTVFTGDGLKTLATEQAAFYKEHAGEKFKQATYEKLLANPLRCSHVVAIGCKRHESVPEMEEIAAVACAVQNMYLSLTAFGYGGYWGTGGITYYPEAKTLFGLDPSDKFMGFFYMGVIATPTPHRSPGSLTEKMQWINK